MRVLLGCSLGGLGHLTPVVAAARSLQRLGHETLVLVPPALSEAAGEAGVAFQVGDEPPRSVITEVWARVRAGPPKAVVGLIDRELFADRCTTSMLDAASRLCREWEPHLVVREPCEYATAVVAHRVGIPQLQVGISQAAIESRVLENVAETIERFGSGVAGAIRDAPYLTAFPASLDPSPWRDTRRFREPLPTPAALPEWWPGDDRPLVYVTFGTVLGHLPEARDVYRSVLDAVADLPARALVTVGRAIDLETLGPVGANTHIERWVPQQDVFPHAQLVVCHGGSGTAFGALAAGVPLVICPLFADQSANARLVDEAGAGVVVDLRQRATGGVGHLGPDDVAPLRDAIASALADPRHRRAAEAVAGEIAGHPTLDDTLAQLLPASACA